MDEEQINQLTQKQLDTLQQKVQKSPTLIKDKIDIIASGGIRNPLDVVKCLALGAKAVGVSKIFLEILVNEGKDALIQEIEKWKKEVKFLMILMNARNIAELDKK